MSSNAMEKAVTEQETSSLDGNVKYSKGKLSSGEDVVISDDINGTRPSSEQALHSLQEMLGIEYINQSTNGKISITKDDIKKFTRWI